MQHHPTPVGPTIATARPWCGQAVHRKYPRRPLPGQAQDPGAPSALAHALYLPTRTNAHPPDEHTESADRVPRSSSQECSPYRDAMCLTIDKPFYTAFICGQCLNNEHGEASYNSCFEIGGSNMTADAP